MDQDTKVSCKFLELTSTSLLLARVKLMARGNHFGSSLAFTLIGSHSLLMRNEEKLSIVIPAQIFY